jgi:hypothetical protein
MPGSKIMAYFCPYVVCIWFTHAAMSAVGKFTGSVVKSRYPARGRGGEGVGDGGYRCRR